MNYTCRLATPADSPKLVPFWQNFAQERAAVDPSMIVKPNFNFEKYIQNQLDKPLSFCYLLEQQNNEQKTIVGCLFIYFYDEAPPPDLPSELVTEHEQENLFLPRRVASVLGMYVHPEHRHPEAIKLLTNAGIGKAEEMKVNDIDLLIGADQTGIQALLQRAGFTKAAVQYTKHYSLPDDADLPSLHPPHPEIDFPEVPTPNAIPLHDPQTHALVRNPQGEPVFLFPLKDDQGELIKLSNELPIYSTPVRDPQTQDFVFDKNGELVVCPVLRDENNQVVEYQGIPQFHPPAYQKVSGKITLKQDSDGNYVFSDIELNSDGKILRSPDGQPIFKSPLF
ncbi:GNAT family N-acetyltransferase [Oscillatoria salina]|uniref:hypothetical protein n=1 Tax=Oscillatoria salina TaxID=331517 RepID=UPI0013B68EC3|nr:hypothetical protein [Oscillatoria salina]MBZ8180517.1 hypothetical protein [Oscillatoria salina IIICB1]NET88960.1 hypothetical protein [Kamptonema sp. SIO1D9]